MKPRQSTLHWLFKLRIQWISSLALASLGVVLTALLTSCSTVDPYPKNWKPIDPAAQSSSLNVSGLYCNAGEAGDRTGWNKEVRTVHDSLIKGDNYYQLAGKPPLLNYYLHPHQYGYFTLCKGIAPDKYSTNAKYIRIDQFGDNSIRIQLFSEIPRKDELNGFLDGEILKNLNFGRDGLKIGGDSLIVTMGIDNIISMETRTLGKSADGSLVMKIVFRTYANDTVIPMAETFTSWFRWQPVRQEAFADSSVKQNH